MLHGQIVDVREEELLVQPRNLGRQHIDVIGVLQPDGPIRFDRQIGLDDPTVAVFCHYLTGSDQVECISACRINAIADGDRSRIKNSIRAERSTVADYQRAGRDHVKFVVRQSQFPRRVRSKIDLPSRGCSPDCHEPKI